MIFLLIVGVPDDPVLKLRDPGVDAGPVAVAAADAPADDAGELVAAVPPLDDHGAARVALARVLAAVGGARAHEDPRDPLVLTRAPVHRHALRVEGMELDIYTLWRWSHCRLPCTGLDKKMAPPCKEVSTKSALVVHIQRMKSGVQWLVPK